MRDLFFKDGIITRAVQLIPFAGFITAPIHAAAGNGKHAVGAMVNGLAMGAAAVAGLGVIATAGVAILSLATVEIPFALVKVNATTPYKTKYQLYFHKSYGLCEQMGSLCQLMIKEAFPIKIEIGIEMVEHCGGSQCYLSRNRGNGSLVLSISDDGEVLTTHHRQGWERMEMIGYPDYGVVTFRRVREPRYYLACSNEGWICATPSCDLQGWEAWIPE